MFLSRQLAASGNAVEAAALLTAIGEAEQAVQLLVQHGACREACLLAQQSVAVSSSARRDAWVAMAAMLQCEGRHSAAAEAFACAGDVGAAIECLQRVGTIKSLIIAGHLVAASSAPQPYRTASLQAATIPQQQVLCALFASVVCGEDYSALAMCIEDDGASQALPVAFVARILMPRPLLLQVLLLFVGRLQSKQLPRPQWTNLLLPPQCLSSTHLHCTAPGWSARYQHPVQLCHSSCSVSELGFSF
jgi:hypothetical protein